MEQPFAEHRSRRGLFTSDVATYEAGRPDYPERVYELLRGECGLGPATRVLEIGPGTGQATHRLLDIGASVTAIELGAEFAHRLEEKFDGRDLVVEVRAFERADLAPASFDLVAAATSFHWLPTELGLRKAAEVLRPGGWLALWWSNFGDPSRRDPFHDALTPVLEAVAPVLLDPPGAGGPGPHPSYALDARARVGDIDASGRFGPVQHEVISWTGRHTPSALRSMFASFSPWLAAPADVREAALDALERLAVTEFGGVVERPYLTSVYLAPRRP